MSWQRTGAAVTVSGAQTLSLERYYTEIEEIQSILCVGFMLLPTQILLLQIFPFPAFPIFLQMRKLCPQINVDYL